MHGQLVWLLCLAGKRGSCSAQLRAGRRWQRARSEPVKGRRIEGRDSSLIPIMSKSFTTELLLYNSNSRIRQSVIVLQVAFLAGCLYTMVGILRLGWVTNFLSHSVIAGFMTGASVIIGLSQVGANVEHSQENVKQAPLVRHCL